MQVSPFRQLCKKRSIKEKLDHDMSKNVKNDSCIKLGGSAEFDSYIGEKIWNKHDYFFCVWCVYI